MKNKKISSKIKYLFSLVIVILILGVLYSYFGESKTIVEVVHGNSMFPTIKDNQSVEVEYGYYQNHQILRGEIVVIDFRTRNEDFVKRVIAIPGDSVLFGKDSQIYLNDNQLRENYISNNESFNKNELITLLTQLEYYNNTIPEGYYLVLGDNRLDSYDSGSYGLILKERIIGKIAGIT